LTSRAATERIGVDAGCVSRVRVDYLSMTNQLIRFEAVADRAGP
jgi:hypothetical protein